MSCLLFSITLSFSGILIMNFSEEIDQLQVIKSVSNAACELGYEAYIVGGFVRDLILKRPSIILGQQNWRFRTGTSNLWGQGKNHIGKILENQLLRMEH